LRDQLLSRDTLTPMVNEQLGAARATPNNFTLQLLPT
jgi:hypothetical protein